MESEEWRESIIMIYTYIEVILIAVALAMDCFSVSIATGLAHSTAPKSSIVRMALLFGLFQALMPLIGWGVTSLFGPYIASFDHWVAVALLAFIGTKMIIDYFREEEHKSFDPTLLSIVLLLAVATSIDALAVGVSFECMGKTTWADIAPSVLIIGFMSFLFTLFGYRLGSTIGRRFHFPAELIGGIILIAIGIKALL